MLECAYIDRIIEYTLGPKYAKILNMLWQGSGYHLGLNMPGF